MSYLDRAPFVISWASEELIVSYKSPVDNKYHRYFPDFLVKFRDGKGTLRTLMIEIKPMKQAKPPKQRTRITKQYINEVMTYGVNQAKWKAAEEYCLDRGWEFRVLTEKDLGIMMPGLQ